MQNLFNLFPYVKGFPKAKNFQSLTTESGSKQRFSLLLEKVVIQAVCLRAQAVKIKATFNSKGRDMDLGEDRQFQQPQTNTF